MEHLKTVSECMIYCDELSAQGLRVAFVPTMGALHAGHLSLIEVARRHADAVVVSIFVNPTQFAPHEDFEAYPRVLDSDIALLEAADVAAVFTPTPVDIYPDGTALATRITVPYLSESLCGKSRPHFFDGVCTVVLRLLHIVRPDVAVFGEKDFQQVQVIRKMTQDFFLLIDIIAAPIIREKNGLALSSRNRYLTDEKRETAAKIYESMCHVRDAFLSGETSRERLLNIGKQLLIDNGFQVDYYEIVDPITLREPNHDLMMPHRICVAAILDGTRLIDTMALGES